MISPGELLRITVVKTSGFWPFSYINKIPYFIAIRLFVFINRKSQMIKGIYIRHGLTEDDWVPGLSDIDITVILRENQDIDKEYLFLTSFWNRYKIFKKLFPMMGEVSILNEQMFKSWQKFTIRGYEYKNWRLVYGENENLISHSNKFNSEYVEIDSINFSITNYLEFFLNEFYSLEYSSTLKLLRLNRLLHKIYKYANKYKKAESRKATGELKQENESEIACCCLKTLEESIEYISPILDTLVSSKNNKVLKHVDFKNVYDLDWFGVDLKELDHLNDSEGFHFHRTPISSFYIHNL